MQELSQRAIGAAALSVLATRVRQTKRSSRSRSAVLRLAGGLLEGMAVSALEPVAGGDFRFTFVVFPHLGINGLPRLTAQQMLFVDVALIIAVNLNKLLSLAEVQPI